MIHCAWKTSYHSQGKHSWSFYYVSPTYVIGVNIVPLVPPLLENPLWLFNEWMAFFYFYGCLSSHWLPTILSWNKWSGHEIFKWPLVKKIVLFFLSKVMQADEELDMAAECSSGGESAENFARITQAITRLNVGHSSTRSNAPPQMSAPSLVPFSLNRGRQIPWRRIFPNPAVTLNVLLFKRNRREKTLHSVRL